MSEERYNGWANRETWAVALHINNDEGWQESVHEALREQRDSLCWDCTIEDDGHEATEQMTATAAGEIVRENVESLFDADHIYDVGRYSSNRMRELMLVRDDLGSLWRVDWTELGAAFLSDLEDE